jgi:hypothetical protein
MYQQNMVADPKDVIIGIRASIVAGHLGDELAKAGKAGAARDECKKAAELLRNTLDDPANVNQRRLRVVAYTGLGDAYVTLSDRRSAKDNYQRALDIMHEHRDRGIADADDLAEIDEVARKAAECEKALVK